MLEHNAPPLISNNEVFVGYSFHFFLKFSVNQTSIFHICICIWKIVYQILIPWTGFEHNLVYIYCIDFFDEVLLKCD